MRMPENVWTIEHLQSTKYAIFWDTPAWCPFLAWLALKPSNETCSSETYVQFQPTTWRYNRAGIAQSVYRLATGWKTQGSDFESR
jgi:hypothetical protein